MKNINSERRRSMIGLLLSFLLFTVTPAVAAWLALSLTALANPSQTAAAETAAAESLSIPVAYRGAYFHKLMSSASPFWHGIKGVLRLGSPVLDPQRFDPTTNWFLDGSNVYVGGNAGGEEIDCGLHWEAALDKQGRRTAKGGYTPFYRNGSWNEAEPERRVYWYPGEEVIISVVVAGPSELKLSISDPGESPARTYSHTFRAAQFGIGLPMSFKRVNDLAQHGNEGKAVIPTESQILNAIWLESYFLWSQADQTVLFPVNSLHAHVVDLPAAKFIKTATTAETFAAGGETISIYGDPDAANAQGR